MVNHRQNFVNPVTGVHAQNIEANWRAGKGALPRHGTSKPMFESYLYQFMWCRKYLEQGCIFRTAHPLVHDGAFNVVLSDSTHDRLIARAPGFQELTRLPRLNGPAFANLW
ncbi:hypothetical protein DFS34DRAFT_288241 [Phlyctochytrium arcticum]|nr:hypothetical protein DFS34DRAFT_288241 [Phlyctochytrium arcticum]